MYKMNLFSAIVFIGFLGIASAGLADDLEPLLAMLLPTLWGARAGLQRGAGNVLAAIQNVGATAQQGANALADVAAYTTDGLGSTVAKVPAGAAHTLHNIDKSPGAVGSIDRTVFGSSKH